ncbi:olfactory receptor 13A1-like [Arvicola amphibius]|uniref:olfactory receptor 13A1-like n=1 Tax=Arvicola amphibius TaxID=1047088 RepID=UPI001C09AEAF|nr:olfactory receptor 13A1-like [Arvicola amphibius]
MGLLWELSEPLISAEQKVCPVTWLWGRSESLREAWWFPVNLVQSSGLNNTCDPELQADRYWAERQTEGIWGLTEKPCVLYEAIGHLQGMLADHLLLLERQVLALEALWVSWFFRAQSQITMNNYTAVVEFVLQGFSGDPGFQAFFLAFFSIFYILALVGNTLIFMAISLNPSLHTPMYFFLANLALLDIVCTSTVLPKLLEGLVGKGSHISYKGCLTQLFFLTWFLGAELLLLTAMAYDRYVAICRPLHYSMLMSRPVSVLLAGSVWVISAVSTSVHTGLMAQLHFCGPNQIRHFLCEIPALLLLSCSPTTLNNIMIVIADVYFGVVNFLFTMISYSFIIASILRIRSAEGKKRAFSTCSAHLVVVTLYYSTVIYTYVQPGSGSSLENGKVVALLYTAVSPTLNPLIYSLRNKDVKVALRKVFPCLVHVEIRDQVIGTNPFLPPYGLSDSNSDYQVWQQAPLPPEPCHWPYLPSSPMATKATLLLVAMGVSSYTAGGHTRCLSYYISSYSNCDVGPERRRQKESKRNSSVPQSQHSERQQTQASLRAAPVLERESPRTESILS